MISSVPVKLDMRNYFLSYLDRCGMCTTCPFIWHTMYQSWRSRQQQHRGLAAASYKLIVPCIAELFNPAAEQSFLLQPGAWPGDLRGDQPGAAAVPHDQAVLV